MLWDAVVTGVIVLFVVPPLGLFVNPLVFLAYVIDLPLIAVPVLAEALRRGEFMRALTSLPAYPVLRMVNTVYMLKAFWLEFVRKRSLRVYEKGH
jgi:hypothetical protein